MKKNVLKIIQIVYDIVSLGFIVFVSVAMALTPSKEGRSVENTISQVVKVPRNSGYNDQYGKQYYYNVSDIYNYNSFNKILSYLLNRGEAYSGFSIESSETPSTHWSYAVNNDNSIDLTFYVGNISGESGFSYTDPIQIKWVSFEKVNRNVVGETIYSDYALRFYNSANLVDSNLVLIIDYQLMSPIYATNGAEINGGMLYQISYYSGISSLYFTRGFFVENDLDGVCLFHDIFEIDNQIDYVESYNNGYNAGRRQGYDEGYVKGSSGVETNAFTVIGQAFEAVSNIFSIQVLPNLPLWVLVFTPLIIAVVIVVVKLIKG